MQQLSWGWPATALGSAWAFGAAALFVLSRPDSVDLAEAAAASGPATHFAVLAAAAFSYLHWRFSRGPLAGWLTLILVMLSTPHHALATVRIADPTVAEHEWWPLVTQVLVTASVVVLLLLVGRSEPQSAPPVPVDPMAAGLSIGICFSALGLTLVRWAPDLVLSSTLVTGLTALLLLLTLAIACLAVRGTSLSRSGRFQVLLGVFLVTLGHVVHHSSLSPTVGTVIHLVASVTGAVLLGYFALAMIRASIRLHRREVANLYARLGESESTARDSRARLHEVASTVAGITSVARLIHEPTVVLPRQRRSLLEDTMDAELSRLGRLTMDESGAVTEFALDDVLRRLVVAQQAQGRSISWEPSGVTVMGRADDLTEVLHVLLDNAAKHGCSSETAVEVRRHDGTVQILVSDYGPGISPELRPHVFEWGTRGGGSGGHGIGLSIARELVEQQGGTLVLDDSRRTGTTFIVAVVAGETRDASSHRAG